MTLKGTSHARSIQYAKTMQIVALRVDLTAKLLSGT